MSKTRTGGGFITEDQRRAVEEKLKGTPGHRIGEMLGVSRSTVFEWLKLPEVQQYMATLYRELIVAARQRLLPAQDKAVELLLTAMQTALDDHQSQDADRIARAPTLPQILQAVEKLHAMGLIQEGKPTRIDADVSVPGAAARRSPVEDLLNLVRGESSGHDPSEVTTSTSASKKEIH